MKGKVPSKKMLGFIQIGPEGMPIPAADFANLLEQYPAIGGEIDCVVDIGDSGQRMRLKRVEMDPSLNAGNQDHFRRHAERQPDSAGRMAPGRWYSTNKDTDEVTPVADTNGLPLIQEGAAGKFDPETGVGSPCLCS